MHSTGETAGAQGKIAFANQLRGIAVLCVILVHYFGVYLNEREMVARYIFAPAAPAPSHYYLRHIVPPTFNFGPFGVALFFLISGFVIPFSLEKMGRGRFLLARVLRIYPTYWIASAILLGGLYLSSRYWGLPFEVDLKQLWANLFLVNAELGLPSIDTVNWTLSVEVKFYLAAVLLWPLIRRAFVCSLLGLAALLLAMMTWWPASWNDAVISMDYLKVECMFCCYLFIGTMFHFAIKQQISPFRLAAATAGMFALFFLMWRKTVLAEQFWEAPANYGYALLVFAACYAARARFRPLRVLDFFAAISYPLYLVHALLGYALIHVMMDQGLPFLVAAAFALLCVTGLATVLHYLVEMPTANAGKALGKRSTARTPPSIGPA